MIDYQSLEEYVLINSKRQRVECLSRNSEGLWILENYASEHKIFTLKSLDFTEILDDLCEDVTFDTLAEKASS